MITLEDYLNGDYGCHPLPPDIAVLKTIKLGSNTLYFNRHLSLFTLKYGIDVPIQDKNGNNIPYTLAIEANVIKGTGCHWGHYIQNGKVFHSIMIAKWDV